VVDVVGDCRWGTASVAVAIFGLVALVIRVLFVVACATIASWAARTGSAAGTSTRWRVVAAPNDAGVGTVGADTIGVDNGPDQEEVGAATASASQLAMLSWGCGDGVAAR
jgi:hypothetical protein